MKKLLIILVGIFFQACATSETKQFRVVSDIKEAAVDVNGISMGNTPTTISLSCSKRWVGLFNSPTGWAGTNVYNVTASPTGQEHGFSQTKMIDPCQYAGNDPGEIRFNLELRQVEPLKPYDIKIENK